jgi:hypothetical protein
LQLERHFADFVEEDRPAVGAAEQSMARSGGPCKGPALMAEHFGLEQFVWNRGTVNRHKGAVKPRRERMDRAGHDLLAGATFSGDQNSSVGAGDTLNQRAQFDNRWMLADQGTLDRRRSNLE